MSLLGQSPSLFKIRLASGAHQGFYVGPASSGLLTQPSSDAERALSLKGFDYMLYTQDSAAIHFGSSVALRVQAELHHLGIDSELIC